jgi:hypothetical protein
MKMNQTIIEPKNHPKTDEFEMNQNQFKIDENTEEVKLIINSKSMKMNQNYHRKQNQPKNDEFE